MHCDSQNLNNSNDNRAGAGSPGLEFATPATEHYIKQADMQEFNYPLSHAFQVELLLQRMTVRSVKVIMVIRSANIIHIYRYLSENKLIMFIRGGAAVHRCHGSVSTSVHGSIPFRYNRGEK